LQIILKYFPNLTEQQQQQFSQLMPLYSEWNEKINVISRKDMDNFYERHVLHSLAIAKIILFQPSTQILDIGTGGGFPGIPLAIMFPKTHFHLVDSIGKKIKVVHEVVQSLHLKNVTASHARAESLKGQYDFVTARAVAPVSDLINWTKHLIKKDSFNALPNGWLFLKGGDLSEELNPYKQQTTIHLIQDFFSEDFFKGKAIVYISK
jgi:16S rRNA (guanine527-N7)-methyltransferase